MNRIHLLTCSAAVLVSLALAACKRESSTAPAQPGTTTPYPGSTVPGAYPGSTVPGTAYPGSTVGGTQPGWTAPPPPATPATMPPAYGFFCATDQDIQCPFGRCMGGRCGGCSNAADCKPGAACMASPFGMVCVAGGSASPPPATTPPPAGTVTAPPVATQPPGADPFATARALCVQRTNEYRARVRAQPLARNAATEPCGDQQARSDSASGKAHGAFGACGEMAQNECPGWPGTPEQVVASCLEMMFNEGPGEGAAHGHYTNMTSPSYSSASCGFSMTADGKLWVVQDFFRQGR